MSLTRRAALAAGVATLAGCTGPVSRSPSPECPLTVPTDDPVSVGFTGDVMLGRGVDEEWRDGPPAGVWGSMADRLASLDALMINLECCVSDRGEPRPGRTYHFRARPDWARPALGAGNVTWASLANNHVLDFGRAALADTLDHLSDAGVARAGAGPDRDAALEPAAIEAGDLDVAVCAFTDQSPSYAAAPDRPGTAYADLDVADPESRRLVGEALDRALERDPDLVVASLHWGPNWEVRPSERQRRFARWLVDRGVDVVHGHSAHVIQGVEVHHGRPIIYDAGDFVDDYVVKPDRHNDRSFLFELAFDDGRADALRLVPVEIRDRAVHRAGKTAAAWLRDRMRTLCEPFETTVVRDGDGLRVPLDCGDE
jgi:poly-gamma-glutamate synthesis protein (capsule biosynthesis protein)